MLPAGVADADANPLDFNIARTDGLEALRPTSAGIYQLLQATSAHDSISAQSRFEHGLSLQHEASQHVRAESMHANYYNVD